MNPAEIELRLVHNFDAAATDWLQLFNEGYATPYQSLDWCQAFQETLGADDRSQPFITVASHRGQPLAILPLCVHTRAGVRVMEFLGAGIGNQNTGLWARTFYDTVDPGTILSLLERLCGDAGIDCLNLQNVPCNWNNRVHPLALDNAQPSPSPVFRGDVPGNFQEFFSETHSKSARKNLTRKQRHLQQAGGYQICQCREKAEIETGLEAFLSQREARAGLTGIPNAFSSAPAQAFLRRATGLGQPLAGGTTPLVIWTLEAAGKIRATYLCAHHSGTLYAYSNSVAHDDMLSNSPGLVLMREIIEEICADPDTLVLDMGLGEERYKTGWTVPDPLCDSRLNATVKGWIFSEILSTKTRLKSAIRNSGRLWPLMRKIRRWRAPDK